MHIMLDLETMGTRPSAPIISIGAVKFTADGLLDPSTGGDYYARVTLESSAHPMFGAVIDPSTVLWWLQQSDEARAEFAMPGKFLNETLDSFREWVERDEIEGVWGNGASFDNVILSETYRRKHEDVPWPFWKDRCYRTVKSMYPDVRMERSGTHHNALDDAISQAKHLIEINKGRNFL